MEREALQYVPASHRWANEYVYSRAVVAGDFVFLTGVAPIADDGSCFAPGDGYAQAMRCFGVVEAALARLGLGRDAIVRSRAFVTDVSRADDYGRAHRDFFAGVAARDGSGGVHRPCFTMVGIKDLVDPGMLIEIECDAVRI